MRLRKIISGGQTGVDRGALDAALACRFPCGGWCPPGREAEDGPIAARYPLDEMRSGGYRQRTIRNVLESDATLILYWGLLRGGTEQTVLHCIKHRKPYKLIDATLLDPVQAAAILAQFLMQQPDDCTLNVAGPRESRVQGAFDYTYAMVKSVLLTCSDESRRGVRPP